ncbi:MAG: Cu(I)/Ag(I) efflux system membrane protein CusA/SilA [Verrucomicrobia bacterium]|nr:MAG: Cu(I)/Ag(I) efflux system membrane protein CusA/SilA [Verrucomicrobiota bacterium]
MLNKLIYSALHNRAVVLMLALLLMGLGVVTTLRMPVEVLPDLTKPTVIILTESPGLAPEEVEVNITHPIERALLGVAGLSRVRSNSDVSLSLVYAEFSWNTDIYKARQLVQERLAGIRGSLPSGAEPFLTPTASLMGEILLIGVSSRDDKTLPRDVRSLADWTIRPRLQSIAGIAEVLNMGGGIKQIQVQPEPHRMAAHQITFEELETAAKESAVNSTGGFINTGPREIMVRNLGMTVVIEDIAGTVVKVVGDRTITISDVARVEWGVEPMRGDGSVNGKRGVVMSLTKAPGFDTASLTAEVEKALGELQKTLPEGVEAMVLFRQADFIEHAIGNLKEAIRDGAIMVTIVIFLFLLNLRTTFITLMAMPLSFAITMLTFDVFGISVNSMTLGGLAVAIGMVVDDAIVDVENVFRRLMENAALKHPVSPIKVIARASGEVRNSILYATLLIILVFLPLLGLSGVEGRLFSPIAIATIVSMVASFIVSLTTIPVLCSFFLNPKFGHTHCDSRLTRSIKALLEHTLLRFGLSQPYLLLSFVGMLVVAAFLLYPQMSKDFLPSFKEETALVSMTAAPGTSLDETNNIADVIEQQLLSIPEVHKVGRRLGRAERGDHVVPVSTAEFDVDFRPIGKSKELQRNRNEILSDVRKKVQSVPGTFSVVMGPLADRIGHMLSGVSAPVAIKIFGSDLDQLRQIGIQVQTLAKGISGFEDCKLDQQSVIPQLRIEIDRERAAAYGITPGRLNATLSTLLGGSKVASLRDGPREIDLTLRLPLEWRESPEKLADIPIEVRSSEGVVQRVPLSLIANVREAKGPNVIFRENAQRRFALAIKPSVRDVGALVEELQRRVTEQVKLPEGYFISYEGEFRAQAEASRRIALLSAAVLVLIGFLLYTYFGSAFFAIQVLCDIPLAMVGGLVFTYFKLNNVSIATLVGFIAVAGVAARNSIMLISHYLHLMRVEGEPFSKAMVIRGTKERLVPVLMTALAAGIGLIPLVLAGDQPGKEILHPVAVVIVGGLVTSTLLGLGVTPTIFYTFGRTAAQHSLGHFPTTSLHSVQTQDKQNLL